MIAIFFIFMVAAAVSMTSTDQGLMAPPPKPAPVVIEKTVVIECVPQRWGERLEGDLTVPFEKRHYLNPTGNPCRKKTVTITKSIEPSEPLEPDIPKDEEWP